MITPFREDVCRTINRFDLFGAPDHAGAIYGRPEATYRYALWQTWGIRGRGHIVFLMLNPSTATERELDPTLRRCMGFAKRWNYDGMIIVNVFALRSTNPKALARHPNPIGTHNYEYILQVVRSRPVIVAWGSNASGVGDRIRPLLTMALRAGCLGLTEKGEPRHPLYVPYTQGVKPWRSH